MPAHISPRGTRTRASQPKVRTGCLTCKIRHKKCDEARPSCRMCTSTGRKCDGYATTIDRRTRASRMANATVDNSGDLSWLVRDGTSHDIFSVSSLSPAVPLQLVDPGQNLLSHNERQYLDFFRRKTSLQCSGYFQRDFWRRLIHQFSEENPAVCHATIALGALHWNFETARQSQTQPDHSFSIQQCNKAISSLRSNTRTMHVETTLITCLLFLSIAFLQGDIHAAGCHLKHGSRLFEQLHSRDNPPMQSVISSTLAHMKLHWSTFAEPAPPAHESPLSDLTSVHPHLSQRLDNLEKASNLIAYIGGIVIQDHIALDAMHKSMDIEVSRYSVLNKVRHWKSELLDVFIFKGHVISAEEEEQMMLLELWSETVYIQTAVYGLRNDNQTMYDNFTPNFQHAIELGKQLLTSSSALSSKTSFSFGTGIIQPLFFCAFRCRDWYLRREVVSLLHGSHRQEGIWTSIGAAVVLEQLIAIESEGLLPGDIVPGYSRVDSVSVELQPGDSHIQVTYRRLRDCNGDDSSDHRGNYKYIRCRYNAR